MTYQPTRVKPEPKTSPVFKRVPTMGFESTSSPFENHNLWIDFPFLENYGYGLGDCSSNWTMWTIWDETLLEELHPWLRLSPGIAYTASSRKVEREIQEGYKRISRDTLTLKDNQLMVKLLKPRSEPFRPLSGSICLEVVEYQFIEEKVVLALRPMGLIANSGLAEILRAVYRETDILMIRGAFDIVSVSDSTGNQKQYILANNSIPDGNLQVIRLTFEDDARTALIEEVNPGPGENRFVFKYMTVSPNGITRRTAIWHQSFKWENNETVSMFEKRTGGKTLSEFYSPIPSHQNAYIAYLKLMEGMPSVPTRSVSVLTRNVSDEDYKLVWRERPLSQYKDSLPRRTKKRKVRSRMMPCGLMDIVKTICFAILMCFICRLSSTLFDDIPCSLNNHPVTPNVLSLKPNATYTDQPGFLKTVSTYMSVLLLWIKRVYVDCVNCFGPSN